jgi:hypothetical protein
VPQRKQQRFATRRRGVLGPDLVEPGVRAHDSMLDAR